MKIKPLVILLIITILPLWNCKKNVDIMVSTVWSKVFGGSGYEYGNDIINTKDGGLAVLGSTSSADGDVSSNKGGYDFWLVKLKQDGSKEWQKSYGGSDYDWGNALIQSSGGGYVMAGYTKSDDGDVSGNHKAGVADVWVVKTDAAGSVEWKFTWGGTAEDNATDIVETSDGGYLVTGYTSSTDGDLPGTVLNSDGFIIKLNSSGIKQWQKLFGGNNADKLYSILATEDGCYVAAGYTMSTSGSFSGNHGGYDGWVVKVDGAGNLKWQKLIGTIDSESFSSIIQTSDGGFAATGSSCSRDLVVSSYDVLAVKMDSLGDEEWTRHLGGSTFDTGLGITETSGATLLLTGMSASSDGDLTGNSGGYDAWVVNIDMTGGLIWQKNFGGSANENVTSAVEAPDKSYVIAGNTMSNNGDISGNHGLSDYWIFKITD